MKKVAWSLVFLSSLCAYGAKVSHPQCQDVVDIQEKVTPEYLAVLDGYNKAGKEVNEVDLGGIVSESDKVKKECQSNKTAKVDTVRKNVAKNAAKTPVDSKTVIAPTKAKCEDFLALEERVQPVAAYWVAGHSKSGQVKKGEVDEIFLERPVAALIEECKATPTASFYDKAKAWIKKHT